MSQKGKENIMLQLIAIEPEKIAEIKNALREIQGNAELIPSSYFVSRHKMMMEIVEQVRIIDKLLPDVKFEGGNRKEIRWK